MEINTTGACWSVGHTTIQGHRRGKGPSYQPCTCTYTYYCMWVCASVVLVEGVEMPAGQFKNSAEWSHCSMPDWFQNSLFIFTYVWVFCRCSLAESAVWLTCALCLNELLQSPKFFRTAQQMFSYLPGPILENLHLLDNEWLRRGGALWVLNFVCVCVYTQRSKQE